jgi:membrane fusion protein, copper/silver efflux system
MTKIKAAGSALLGVIILASYFIYPHISISWRSAQPASPGNTATTEPKTASLPSINPAGQGKVWVCPMHPEIMQDHPGTCPICGMDMVESKNHTGHDHGIRVDTASLQKLGVRLEKVNRMPLSQSIRTYGNVGVDESALYKIHSKFEGWIKKSYIHFVGQKITQGQVIYEIYSPQLIVQQNEYIRFLERREQLLQTVGDSRFQENAYVMDLILELSRARTKFLHEDVDLETVQKIEDSRQPIEVVKVTAAESGTVTGINAREGSIVSPPATLFTLSSLAHVWVTATLYPDQSSKVETGNAVTVYLPDGQSTQGKIDFLNPVAENNQVSARIEINNLQLHLRPGSFVDVTIHTQSHEALVVPSSAVLRTGDGNVVMLYRGEGHFLPVYVDTGIESNDLIEITDGLQPGAEVAVNGQFLLDSAASMNAAIERLQSHEPMPAESATQAGHMEPAMHDAPKMRDAPEMRDSQELMHDAK